MARLLLLLTAVICLQVITAAPADLNKLLEKLLAKRMLRDDGSNEITSSVEVSEGEDDSAIRDADAKFGHEMDPIGHLQYLGQFINHESECGEFHQKKPEEITDGRDTDFEKLAVGPAEAQNVVRKLKEYMKHSDEKMQGLKAATKDAGPEDAPALAPIAMNAFKSLGEKGACIVGLLMREFMRIELFGAKGFTKTQYRCRHMATSLLKLAYKSKTEKTPITHLMDGNAWAGIGTDFIADLRCLADEVKGVAEAVGKTPDVTAETHPNDVGRGLITILMEFFRIKQDAEILMKTGEALEGIHKNQKELFEGKNTGEVKKELLSILDELQEMRKKN